MQYLVVFVDIFEKYVCYAQYAIFEWFGTIVEKTVKMLQLPGGLFAAGGNIQKSCSIIINILSVACIYSMRSV